MLQFPQIFTIEITSNQYPLYVSNETEDKSKKRISAYKLYIPTGTKHYKVRLMEESSIETISLEIWEPLTAFKSAIRNKSGGKPEQIFNGRWMYTGEVILSMGCGTGIPILRLSSYSGINLVKPQQYILDCKLGGMEEIEQWKERWNPDGMSQTKLPEFVLEALKRDAIVRKEICPITLEPFSSPEEIIVTRCYHLFNKESLEYWRREKSICPVCKKTL